MTDIATTTTTTTTTVSLHRPSLLRLQLPKLDRGRTISETSTAIVQAFEMAYVAPFSVMQPKRRFALDPDLDGRDPNW